MENVIPRVRRRGVRISRAVRPVGTPLRRVSPRGLGPSDESIEWSRDDDAKRVRRGHDERGVRGRSCRNPGIDLSSIQAVGRRSWVSSFGIGSKSMWLKLVMLLALVAAAALGSRSGDVQSGGTPYVRPAPIHSTTPPALAQDSSRSIFVNDDGVDRFEERDEEKWSHSDPSLWTTDFLYRPIVALFLRSTPVLRRDGSPVLLNSQRLRC